MNYSSLFIVHLTEHQNAAQAPAMQAYMKNRFDFLGIKSPERKAALRSFIQTHGLPISKELDITTRELWSADKREIHYCAQELFFKGKGFRHKDSIELIEFMITHQSWWDTVDYIASNLCGSYFKLYPEAITENIMKWNSSENMWLVRASILFQLKYKEQIDVNLLQELMEPHLQSQEFFLQKAIGWMLRETSKWNPDFVIEYVRCNQLKPVSLREANKYI